MKLSNKLKSFKSIVTFYVLDKLSNTLIYEKRINDIES